MVTASSVFGGTGRKVSEPPPAAAVAGSVTAANAACGPKPAPTTSAPAAPALNTPRRVTALASRSPKYEFSEVFGTGWSQALPQRYWQVIALRAKWPRARGSSRRCLGGPGTGPPGESDAVVKGCRAGR